VAGVAGALAPHRGASSQPLGGIAGGGRTSDPSDLFIGPWSVVDRSPPMQTSTTEFNLKNSDVFAASIDEDGDGPTDIFWMTRLRPAIARRILAHGSV
jgi:hypothetical protein